MAAPLHTDIHTPQWTDTPLHRPPAPGQCMLGYGQQAGGTHPTGMHSCSYLICYQEGAVEVHNVGRCRCRHPSNRCDRVAAALCLAPLPLPTRHVESPQDVCGKRVSAACLYCLYVPKGLFTPTVTVIVSVKVYHYANGDGPFDWQNGFCTHSAHQMVHLH